MIMPTCSRGPCPRAELSPIQLVPASSHCRTPKCLNTVSFYTRPTLLPQIKRRDAPFCSFSTVAFSSVEIGTKRGPCTEFCMVEVDSYGVLDRNWIADWILKRKWKDGLLPTDCNQTAASIHPHWCEARVWHSLLGSTSQPAGIAEWGIFRRLRREHRFGESFLQPHLVLPLKASPAC